MIEIARTMRSRSQARQLSGTLKEVLGTAQVSHGVPLVFLCPIWFIAVYLIAVNGHFLSIDLASLVAFCPLVIFYIVF